VKARDPALIERPIAVPPKNQPVVFYDQDCALCDHSIRYLLEVDVADVLKFAPLQGRLAEEVLERALREDLDTYVVHVDGKPLTRGLAVKYLVRRLDKLWMWRWLLLIPTAIVNIGYNIVGKTRYRIFGRTDQCIYISEPLKDKFLV
jgi:predicted DCC family thiol-disulfide oxidoreductase YuxK